MGKAVTTNHVGVGVGDIDAAVRFYKDALDYRVLVAPFDIHGETAAAAVDMLKPPLFRHMRLAHIVSGDDVGIELFQLIDPPYEAREQQLEYWKSGVFHFCITDPDIDERVERIVKHGGRRLSKTWKIGEPNILNAYACDPWGTIIEVSTLGYRASFDK